MKMKTEKQHNNDHRTALTTQRPSVGYNDDHLSRPATTTMSNTTPLSLLAQSASKRSASQISGGASDDRGQQAADDTTPTTATATATATTNANADADAQAKARSKARSSKAQMKAKDHAQFITDNYKSRDDIEIVASEVPEIVCSNGATTRLKSVCNVAIKELPLKALRFVFTTEGIEKFSSKTKKEVCERIVAFKINSSIYDGQSSGGDAIAVVDRGTPKQQLNSFFRFINALSVSEVKILYANIGKQPTAAELTAGRTSRSKSASLGDYRNSLQQ
jgi:hypothetical protein